MLYEVITMIAYGLDQFGQMVAALVLILAVDIFFPADQGDLGVDDDILAFRQVNEHIGFLQPIAAVPESSLGFILDTPPEAGSFQHPLEYHLSPVALDSGIPFECLGQVYRLLIDLQVEVAQSYNFV